MLTPAFADVREDDEVWVVTKYEPVATAEQPREKVVVRVEAVPEARELQTDRR
jgi:hypothetical protein